jgi:arsenite methyltransferase
MTRHSRIAWVAASSVLACTIVAGGQQRSPQMQQRTPEEYAKFLEGAERVAKMQVPRVVAALGVKPGMKVADIGSGSGLFTRPVAKIAAPGTVYAVDIDDALLKIVARSASDAGLSNIQTVLGTASDPRLPAPVDLIFLCDTLHHIANPGEYLKGLRKYVAPAGRIAVIDFKESWPDGHEKLRFSTAQFEAWMKDAGFTPAESFDWLENSFFVIYR